MSRSSFFGIFLLPLVITGSILGGSFILHDLFSALPVVSVDTVAVILAVLFGSFTIADEVKELRHQMLIEFQYRRSRE